MDLIFPAIVVGVLVLVGGIIYGSYVAEKKRAEAFQRVAGEMGFDFLPKGDATFFQSLSGFHLFSQGHSKRHSNLMRGRTQDLEVAIFDYRYVTGSGKHSHTWNHTVIAFRFEGAALPDFSLRPESFGHRIEAWFGRQDIDFETHARFSRQYLLRGTQESAIRELFSPTVLDFFEQKPGLSTEGGGNMLLFYRHAKRVRPDAIRTLMEEGFGVLTLFRPT
jgi:hypothetical protein